MFLPESPPSGDEFWSRIAITLPFVTIFIAFLITYTWLPNTRVRLQDAWLPALLASLAFNISTVVLVQWLKQVPAYEEVYGGISAVIALMAWVYVSSIIMLVGAMATSRYSAYLAGRAQRKRLENLSYNLERVRTQPIVLAVNPASRR